MNGSKMDRISSINSITKQLADRDQHGVMNLNAIELGSNDIQEINKEIEQMKHFINASQCLLSKYSRRFQSGYHGHHRSKSRVDIHDTYRHKSKPIPPYLFEKRSATASRCRNRDYIFSKHDNRHSFLSDATYFETGLGRRRFQKTQKKSPIEWSQIYNISNKPTLLNINHNKDFIMSVYTETFPPKKYHRKYFTPIETKFDKKMVSMYDLMFDKSNYNVTPKGKKQVHRSKESVAKCLIWR
ncbi:hypothetical protein A3Q56_00371 [Intoshia linei]|uniref:Domain of unknown function with conserved HDNR motif domain-containing protein n=1 Tax=Intoshia linei TaxID=1819745 RepID=A0A177BDU1_9BILA|nr:hypothetical protein A3Q56_00371 [Intoshia linei]